MLRGGDGRDVGLTGQKEMLVLDQLTCKRDERVLFIPLSDTVADGECVALTGANGAGKTTLLRTLAGIHTQFDGTFSVTDFLYSGHRVALDELLTPVENLRWYAALEGMTPSDADLRTALARVDMLSLAMTPCQRFSQGQLRRVGMARWLLSQARLWLLDEPLTSLDQAGQALLNDIIAAHTDAGGAVFCATHAPLAVTSRAISLHPAGGEP